MKKLLCIALALTLVYWLFADTLAHYARASHRSGELRFSYWGSYTDHAMWSEIIAAFERTHPDTHIRPEWLPLSGYATKLDQQFVAGDAPDVIMFQDEPFPRYAREQFLDLGPLLAADAETQTRFNDCWPTATASFLDGSALRGIPINGGNVLIYCNLDAFERASRFRHQQIHPPSGDWTLDDFIATCKDLTIDEDNDGEPEQFGILQPHWVYYLPFIWSHGANLLDESKTKWTLVGPSAVAAFATYADLRFRYHVAPAPMEYAGQNSDTAFLSGRVAMCVNGPWFQPFLNATALKGRYTVVNIPSGPGGAATRVTWDGLCIYSKTSPQRQEQAWQFLRYVLSDETQQTFARYQRAIPARQSIGPYYVEQGGGVGSPAETFVKAMKTARPQPITKDWQVLHNAMQRNLTSVLLEGAAQRTPQQAIDALAHDPALMKAFGGKP